MIVDQVETDAYLGYIKIFATEIHDFMEKGVVLSASSRDKIKIAHDRMQRAYASVIRDKSIKQKSPDKTII